MTSLLDSWVGSAVLRPGAAAGPTRPYSGGTTTGHMTDDEREMQRP